MTLTDIELLRQTYDHMLQYGWVQNSFHEDLKSCLLGTVRAAGACSRLDKPWDEARFSVSAAVAMSHFNRSNVMRELRETIKQHDPDWYKAWAHTSNYRAEYIIPRWNDEPGRTVDEVFDVIQATIKRLEERDADGRTEDEVHDLLRDTAKRLRET